MATFWKKTRSLAVALIVSTAALAGRTPEWVRPLLTTDVSALGHGHGAVRLADIGVTSYTAEGRVRRLARGAVRVMNENGRSRAHYSLNYDADTEKVIAAHAWIVSADGNDSDSFGLSDFLDTALNIHGVFWPQQRVLSFSAVDRIEVKGVLIWEIEVESQAEVADLTWMFLDDMPTLLTALDVIPPPGGQLAWHASNAGVPAARPGSSPGALHWEERDHRPPLRGELPDGFLPAWRMIAIRVIPANASAESKTWGAIARMASDVIRPRIQADSPELTAKANALIAGKATRWERIRALAEFVQKDVTYLSVVLDKDCLAGYRPHPASEVLHNRFGDCKDKTTLLIALLRAVGEDAEPMLVFSGNPTMVHPEWPSPRFNHVITCIPADREVPADWPVIEGAALGKRVLFDPTNEFTPLGVFPREDQAGFGLIVSPQSTELIQLPSETSGYRSEIEAKLDAGGDVNVTLVENQTGNIAAESHGARERHGSERFKSTLASRLHETVSLVDELHWTDAWESQPARWTLHCDFIARRHVGLAGELMLLNPKLVATRRLPRPWKTQEDGLVWSAGNTAKTTVRITLPAGARIEEMPDEWHVELPGITGSVKYSREGDVVVCQSELTRKAAFLDKQAYEAQRLFLQKFDNAERRPIVVRKPTS